MRKQLALCVLLAAPLAQAAEPAASGADQGFGADPFGNDAFGSDSWDSPASATKIHGFFEGAAGGRLQNDPALGEDLTLGEARARLEWADQVGGAHYSIKGDVYADGVENGIKGDLREAMVQFTPMDKLDIHAGQQVSTWGTGDMLFLNDLFPKDWKSFFSGRDETYLKAPAPSIKGSYYASAFSVDLVWTPLFEPDRYIDGERFSYFSPVAGKQLAAPDGVLRASEPDNFPEDGELAARVSGLVGSTEWAFYGYRGFWKQPMGVNGLGQPIFPRLDVYGASLRGTLGGGIANTEFAWYNGQDSVGNDPSIPNDQLRFLVGYDHELIPKLTGAAQYYVEWTQDYSALKTTMAPAYRPDEFRQVLTMRLTWRLMQDNLTLSWFNYWSPSDQDYYLRPSASYRMDDHWTVSGGANLFGGKQPHTFFGQFADASNLWLRLRYSY